MTEGDDAEYTVRLATQPTATVTVAVTGQASTDLTLSAASLTFTTSTWNTAQTVTVSAAEDDDAVNDAATLLHTASGGDYAGETAEVGAVTVTDGRDGGPDAVDRDVGGGRGGRRRVHGASGDAADGDGDGGGHGDGQHGPEPGFDLSDVHDVDLETPAQTVTVSAAEDDDAVNDTATLLHTASGGDYAGETAEVAVTVTGRRVGGPDAVDDGAGG